MFRICFVILPLVYAFNLFNQNTYKMVYHHGTADEYNKELVDNFRFGYNKYNRTTRAFDLNVRLLKRVDSMKVLLEASKFINNEYRSFTPINMVFDLCYAIRSDLFGLRQLVKYGNVSNCPFQKDYYVINKFRPDDNLFPPNIPLGQYKFSLSFNGNDKFLFKFSVVTEVMNRKVV